MPEMRRYEGRAVLVTGGGSGIGEACCVRLASEGAKVAVLDVDGANAEAVASGLGGAIAIEADVSDYAAVEAAVAEVVRRLGPLKLAVNNAGIGGARLPPEQTPLDQWRRLLRRQPRPADAGVVHRQLQRAQPPHDFGDGRLDGVRIRDVELNGDRARTQPRRHRPGPCPVDVEHRDLGALGRQPHTAGLADPRPAAGDQDHSPLVAPHLGHGIRPCSRT